MITLEPMHQLDLVSVVSAIGWIRPHLKVDVQADVMGRIVALNGREGDHVTKGQVLLRIDPTQYQATVARMRAMVSEAMARQSQASANLIQANRAYERAVTLTKSGQKLISRQAVE